MAEVPILIKLLLSLKFVDDPKQADLFLVPALPTVANYPFFIAWDRTHWFFKRMWPLLTHHRSNASKPHLFLSTIDQPFSHPWLRPEPFLVSLGPKGIVVPSLNSDLEIQPGVYQNLPPEERHTLLYVNFSPIYPVRKILIQQVKDYNGTSKIEFMSFKERMPTVSHFGHTLSRTRFVLCPHGDLPYTKRFFDALVHGAIPVMIETQYPYGPSWYQPVFQMPEVIQGLINESYPDIGMPILEVVVVVQAAELESEGFNIVEHLERVPEPVVRKKLELIGQIRSYFLYDYNGTTVDAFTLMLRRIRRMLQSSAV